MDLYSHYIWTGRDASIEIPSIGLTLSSPFTYAWKGEPVQDPDVQTGPAVDPALPIRLVDAETADHARRERIRQGINPFSYANLSPEERGVYVRWLAGGRVDLLPFPELYWLYLAGIEGRLLKETTEVKYTPNSDTVQLLGVADYLDLAEIDELLELLVSVGSQITDPKCRSAYRGLWKAVSTSLGRLRVSDKPIPADCRPFAPMRPAFGLRLAEMAHDNKPLDAETAALYASWYGKEYFSKHDLHEVSDYCDLWLQLWKARYKNPVTLRAWTHRTGYRYRLATDPHLTVELRVDKTNLVQHDSAVGTHIKYSAMQIFEALKPYAHEMLRGDPHGEAHLRLPPELLDPQTFAAFETLHGEVLASGGVLLTAKSMARRLGLPLNHVMWLLPRTASTLNHFRLEVLADPASGGVVLNPDDPFVLHPSASEPDVADLRLYRILAGAAWLNGQPTPRQSECLTAGFAAINEYIYEGSTPKTNWKAQAILWRVTEVKRSAIAPGMRWVERIVESQSDNTLMTILKKHALGIVLADGSSPDAIRAAEKLYKSMGLAQEDLYRDLAGGQTEVGELDLGKVEKLQHESRQAASMLQDVFTETDEEPHEEKASPDDTDAVAAAVINGLDEAHCQLLAELLSQPEWPRATLEAICSRHGLLLDGAIERLNEDAWERFGQPLIEGDDPLAIDAKTASEYTLTAANGVSA